MKLSKLVYIFFLTLPVIALSDAKKSADEPKELPAIKRINAAVDGLEKRISEADKKLPMLKVEYDFHDATEGVPPDLKFYFETKKVNSKEKSVLRAFKTHVGREVYSVDRFYYFDETGQPMKFLKTSSRISGEDGSPASRNGVIYDKSGHKIWSSPDAVLPLSFEDVKSMFDALDRGLNKFQ